MTRPFLLTALGIAVAATIVDIVAILTWGLVAGWFAGFATVVVLAIGVSVWDDSALKR